MMLSKEKLSIKFVTAVCTSVVAVFSGAAVADSHLVKKAVAVITPTEGNKVNGVVTFEETPLGVKVHAQIKGLSPGEHGFHVHQFGDISASDGTSAGGHFNPFEKPHAGPSDAARHVGDLGNIKADESGEAHLMTHDAHLALSGPGSIIGHAVVVHGGTDDLSSQPAGAAGPRVGVGVIGVAEPGEPTGDPMGDEEYLNTLLKVFAVSFLNQNIEAIMALFSDSFDSPDQGDKASMREFLGGAIDQGFLEDAEIDFSEAETTIEGETARIYPVEIAAAFGSATLDLNLAKEGNKWLIVGMTIEGI